MNILLFKKLKTPSLLEEKAGFRVSSGFFHKKHQDLKIDKYKILVKNLFYDD